MRSYSIRELLRAVRRLPATMPHSDRLFKRGYDTHKDHWTRWLGAYNTPGYYGRADTTINDARTVYQRLNCGPMIVWLNEAAGEDPTLIKRTIREMRCGEPRAQTEAMIARQFLPWERAAWLLFGYRSYTIPELLRAVRRLPATTPESDRLSKGVYATHKDHWIGWLEEYDGPGYYSRSNWDVDARTVYQRLNNGNMIVWINEAAGESPTRIRLTIAKMLQGGPRKQMMAMIARSFLPWERTAWLLLNR
jgi:hypothetical protein